MVQLVPVYKGKGFNRRIVGHHQVDDDQFEFAAQFNWSLNDGGYAARYVKVNGRTTVVLLHREIWIRVRGLIPDGLEIDHMNGIRSDHRIENLDVVNDHQQGANKRKTEHRTTSRYLRVCWSRSHEKWMVNVANRTYGYYDDEEVAARVADQIAIALYGEYTSTNFSED